MGEKFNRKAVFKELLMPTTAVILCVSFWVFFSVNLTACHFPDDCA